MVFAGSQLALSVSGYAIVNLVFVAVWLVLVVAIAKEHRKLTAVEEAKQAA